MNHKQIVDALYRINPEAKWALRGEDLSGLEWQDERFPRPSDEEISAAILSYVPPPSVQEQVDELRAKLSALLAAK